MDDRRALAEAMGWILAEMHGLAWPHAGTYDHASRGIIPFDASYGLYIAERTRTFLRDFQRYARTHGGEEGAITDGDLEWADALIAGAATACEVPFVPTLVMGDFHERNVVADRNGQWAIRGVFDFPTAHVGDGEADLSRCFASYHEQEPELAQAFLAAYTRLRPPADGFRERFALYLLADRAQIWAFGYSQKLVWWDRRLSFRDWVRGYLAVGAG